MKTLMTILLGAALTAGMLPANDNDKDHKDDKKHEHKDDKHKDEKKKH